MSRHARQTTFIVVLDCSPSMDCAFLETTRRKAALHATWSAVRALRAAPCRERVRVAQVLFESSARTHLPLTPVARVRKGHLGCEAFSVLGGTNICAGLAECESILWPGMRQSLGKPPDFLQALTRLFALPQEYKDGPPLPLLLGGAHVLAVSDGEQNTGGSEADCIRQAERLKNAGVRLYAHGIGDPRSFGLLRRLVSDPRADFGVHQSPASLLQTFCSIAQRLVREQ